MRRLVPIIASALLLGLATAQAADPDPALEQTAREIKAALDAHIAAMNNGDTEALKTAVHSRSPWFKSHTSMVQQAKPAGNTRQTRLIYFRLLAIDEPFAFVRAGTLLEQTDGDYGPRGTQIDNLLTYRKENGAWKQWSTATLSAGRVDLPPAAAPPAVAPAAAPPAAE